MDGTKDGGGNPEGEGGPPKKISFRDKVLGGSSTPTQSLPEDLVLHNLAKIELHEGDKQKPRISFDKSVIEAISAPWQEALVIKLLGRNVGYLLIKEKLKSLWRLQGGFDIMSAGGGYYMVKFDCVEDRERVIG